MKMTATARKSKHLILDQAKLKQAQRVLGAKTETETIERALTLVLSEAETERRAWAATEKLLRSGITIADVFGRVTSRS
jgi:cytosine/adenosine deaminase-related metal-dependent hydrolase